MLAVSSINCSVTEAFSVVIFFKSILSSSRCSINGTAGEGGVCECFRKRVKSTPFDFCPLELRKAKVHVHARCDTYIHVHVHVGSGSSCTFHEFMVVKHGREMVIIITYVCSMVLELYNNTGVL